MNDFPGALNPFLAQDERFMRLALHEAEGAGLAGEVPIGCLIVKDGRILGRGRNRMETAKDPTAHAEILAIGAACQAVDNWRLDGCTLYVTLEPCPMCAGAILNSRLSRVVYAARDKRLGALGSTYDILNKNPINRIIQVEQGSFGDESLQAIKAFFKELRIRKSNRRDNSELEKGSEEIDVDGIDANLEMGNE
jgi:tRNA(adenine34) deaminase